jgi:succinate dehydrogenase/fumarate reductase flavoprotein subunit
LKGQFIEPCSKNKKRRVIKMTENIKTDVLVIGGGGAAVRAAIEAARAGVRVDLADKGKVGKSGSSPGALVGFAARMGKDDSDRLFFQDWLKASGNICDQNLVWEAVTRSGKEVQELEKMGLEFMRNSDGSLFLSMRTAHSAARGLMVKSEGPEHTNVVKVLRAEAEKRGVNFHEGVMITRLLKKNGRVIGATGIDQQRTFWVFSAKTVILAAGGANRLYPNIADGIDNPMYRTTGDAFSLAFYAGAPLVDMEFSQFRDSPPAGPLYGAQYFNALGERFMEKYDPKALERAPRYVVSGAIYREQQEGRGPITWKVIEGQVAKSRAPVGHEYSTPGSVEITLQFQRLMGGAHIDVKAVTPVDRLFAAGESAGGVHGGDRMQSTGFLDTQVFGANAGRNAASLAKDSERIDIGTSLVKKEQDRLAGMGGDLDPVEFTRLIQNTMWENVGVVRDKINLQKAIVKLEEIRKESCPRISNADIFASLEAANLALAAEIVARAALTREETRSAQIRSDFPLTSDGWVKHVCINRQGEDIKVSTIPVVTISV